MHATFRFVEIFSLDRWQVCVKELVTKELEQCGGVFTRCIRHDNLANKTQNSNVRKKNTNKNKTSNRYITTKTKQGYTRWNQEVKQDTVMCTSGYGRLIHYFIIKHAHYICLLFSGDFFVLWNCEGLVQFIVCPITPGCFGNSISCLIYLEKMKTIFLHIWANLNSMFPRFAISLYLSKPLPKMLWKKE